MASDTIKPSNLGDLVENGLPQGTKDVASKHEYMTIQNELQFSTELK